MSGAAGRLPVSVLIPTLNEERNLPACLDSVAWADEVVVFDSLSTDSTVEVARARGAAVVQRRFDSFATHKNWALDNVPFRHEWLLILDADERIPAAMHPEIAAVVGRDGDPVGNRPVGYYIARKIMLDGRWLRHGGRYPDYNMRLFRRGHGRYEDRLVHEHVILDGPAGYLRTPLLHDDGKGIERYFDRHNHYSSLEAVEIARDLAGHGTGTLPPNLLVKGPQRTRALKHFAYRWVPMRPLVAFAWFYVGRLGLLDGRAGLTYCLLRAIYEYQISLKLRELRDPDSPLSRRYAERLSRG